MAIDKVVAKLIAKDKDGVELDYGIYSPEDIDDFVFQSTGEHIGYYIASTSAPNMSSYNLKDGVFDLQVTATTTGGNFTTVNKDDPSLGESCKLQVKERHAPQMQFTSPNMDYVSMSKPEIKFKAWDSSYDYGIKNSGINSSTLTITLFDEDNNLININSEEISAVATNATIEGSKYEEVYFFSYSPTLTVDGTYSLTIQISDNDGNNSTAITRIFQYDSSAPDLKVDYIPAITNNKLLEISGTTEDAEGIVVTIKVTSESGESVTYTPTITNGAFTEQVTLFEGNNTIEITSTDSLGNSTPAHTTQVLLDSSVPSFKEVIIMPNPVDNGKSLLIKVKVDALLNG